jgi:hypothetical protein
MKEMYVPELTEDVVPEVGVVLFDPPVPTV